MSSKVEICNVALTLLRSATFENFTDSTDSAQKCARIYDYIAKLVMGLGPWPSTIKRVSLAQLSETPAFKFEYYYQLPVDFIRALEVNECTPGEVEHRIEGNKIATNENTFDLCYISFLDDSALYDIYLENSIVEHLMAYLTYSETGNQRMLLNALDLAKKNAQMMISYASAQGSSKDTNLGDDYLAARL